MKKREHINILFSGSLPHWMQDNVIQFVTFRLNDSLPQERLLDIREEISCHSDSNKEDEELFHKYEKWLDAGAGECILKRYECQKVVVESLKVFDGELYDLYDYVIMPNHVHLLLRPFDGAISEAMRYIKGRSARGINHVLGRRGAVWQKGYFDRMIRSVEDFEAKAMYIYENAESIGAVDH